MKKFAEPLAIISIIVIVISLSFIPLIKASASAPPNTVFTMVHNYILDYYIYLYHIAQGQNGNLISYELHTSEPHIGTLTRIEYTLPTFIISPLKLPPYIVYHYLRLFYAIFFALSVYYFVSLFAKNSFQRIFLFFLSYASAGFIKITTEGPTTFITHLTQIDAMRRSTFIPHYTLSNGLFLFILAFIFKNRVAPAAVLLFFLTLINPFHSIIILIVLSISFVLRKFSLRNLLFLLLSFLPSFLYVFFVYSQEPLSIIKVWESKQFDDFAFNFKNYLLTIGPIIFLSPFGALIALKKGGLKNISIVVITIIIYIFLSSTKLFFITGISNFRFYGFPTFVFLGIFAFYTINLIKKPFVKHALFAIMIIISSFFYLTVYRQISSEFKNYPYNAYIPKELHDGFLWIKNNSLQNDIVLTRFITGNMLPAFSARRVFIGHQITTINFPQKLALVEKFYTNQMTAPEAQKFLKDNNITLVFVGLEESSINVNQYPFLKPAYKNSSTTIYLAK